MIWKDHNEKKEEKEPSIEECETMLYEAFNRVMNKSHSTKYKLVKVEEPVNEESQDELWLSAEHDIKLSIGTYNSDLICNIARWAVDALKVKYKLQRKQK